jgi:hypothetical protein
VARVRTAFAVPLVEVAAPAPADAAAPPTDDVPAPAVAALPAQADPPTGKYLGLFTYLAARTDGDVTLSIDEVEATVTGALPGAARRTPSWWGNDPGPRAPHTRAWLAAGLAVADVDLDAGTVRLVRAAPLDAVTRDGAPAGEPFPVA